MSLNDTSAANRIHIGFFGMRNAGKSSVVNAITNQNLSIVSDTLGTTTDPVKKAMELLPLGPVVIIDTPGFDDVGELGELRIKKTLSELNRVDIAILVIDANIGKTDNDRELIKLFNKKEIPYLIVYNKSDSLPEATNFSDGILVSSKSGYNIDLLKESLGKILSPKKSMTILDGLVKAGDFVVLVIPIDESAPKGRIILPQQLALRDCLDKNATAICCQDTDLATTLSRLGRKPDLVVTDSQAFKQVAKDVAEDIPLTSFSILMARMKGVLDSTLTGITALDSLKAGSTVLIAEGCTHHRQCNDIGTVKIPKLLKEYTGNDINIKTCSGWEFPEDLSSYDLIIHCGGCMLNDREVQSRIMDALDQGIPITNYGLFISNVNGILKRAIKPIENANN